MIENCNLSELRSLIEGKKSYTKEAFISRLKSGGDEYSIRGDTIIVRGREYNLKDFDKFNISSHHGYLSSNEKKVEFKL